MISYELAVAIKEAGFPQTWPQNDYMEIRDAIAVSDIYAKYPEQFNPYRPSLEELIEACPKSKPNEYSADWRFILWWSGKEWRAGYYTYGDEDYVDDYPNAESGSTPEEAVANFYLKINKK